MPDVKCPDCGASASLILMGEARYAECKGPSTVTDAQVSEAEHAAKLAVKGERDAMLSADKKYRELLAQKTCGKRSKL